MFATEKGVTNPPVERNLLHAYKKLIRPTVVLMGLTNGMVGVIYAGIGQYSLIYSFIALLSIACIAAFSYGYNQLTDLDEDRINSPTRPLVTGELSVKECKVFLAILLALSIVPLLIFGRYLALIFMLVGPVFSGVAYSRWRVKGFIIKPFFVAYGWSFVPLIGYTAVANKISPVFIIFVPFFLSLMFLTTTMGDLRDVMGDKENGVRSLPVLFGVRAVVTNMKIYAVVNYLVLITGIVLNILPLDAALGVVGGILLFRFVGSSKALSKQKGMRNSLARFSWITSVGIVVGRGAGIIFGIIF